MRMRITGLGYSEGVRDVVLVWERDEWWEAGRNCLLGQYKASGGVRRNRLAKEGGLNEEDNWIRLHGSVQRGGVGGYLILDIGV
eukprot:scaffold3674_cov51-Attheya_sp.AAC.1